MSSLHRRDIPAAVLLLVLAVWAGASPSAVSAPPDDSGAVVVTTRSPQRRLTGRTRLLVSLLLLLALVVSYGLVVLAAAQWEDGLSAVLAVALGMLTIWTSWGFYLASNAATPKEHLYARILRRAIVVISVIATGVFWVAAGPLGHGDELSILVFLVCQVVAAVFSWLA